MLISRSTCAPRLESSCSSNTLMKEDSGYRMESSDFCRLGSIKYLEFFPSFFFLFFFYFFIHVWKFQNGSTLWKCPSSPGERQSFAKLLFQAISSAEKFSGSSFPFARYSFSFFPPFTFLSLSLFRIFPILDALHHPSLPPLNGTSSRFLH